MSIARTATALCLLLMACSSTNEDPSTCDVPAGDCYRSGMERQGSQSIVRLLEASPGPPERGDFNVWTLEVTDLDGNPMENISVRVDPTMPSHGHGTTPLPTVTALEGTDTQYEARPLNLFMPGLWQIRVYIEGLGEDPESIDSVDFEFWIES